MKEKLTFLGIETSCDETAASIVQEKNDGTGRNSIKYRFKSN